MSMVDPTEIKYKAVRLYRQAVQAWVEGEQAFFPKRIPANLKLPEGHAEALQAVSELRAKSKEMVGAGYRVEWEEVNTRKHGKNRIPRSIWIDTMQDLLFLAKKQKDFEHLSKNIELIRRRLPQLEDWIVRRWNELVGYADELESLLTVCEYIVLNPRPNCFVRELPVPISTKLIEQHERMLGNWLDQLLPAESIDSGVDWRDFERRYGFKYFENHLQIRALDPQVAKELSFPFQELSLPIDSIAKLQIHNINVLIVENKTTLAALRPMSRFIALGGLGFNLSSLSEIKCLHNVPLYYWGDLDVHGLQILALMRSYFPQTRSVLMDLSTLERFRAISILGEKSSLPAPFELADDEKAAYDVCNREQLQIEQEKLPIAECENWLK